MRTLFHITTRSAWEAAQRQGRYEADSLRTEGFIHLSRPHQVLRTARGFFAGQNDLLLLQIHQEVLQPLLKYEQADGDSFPHLYGPLELGAVIGAFEFREGPSGFEFPEDFQLIGDTLVRLGRPDDEAEITSCHTQAWQQSYRGLVPDPVLNARPLSFWARLNWWRSVVRGQTPNTVFVAESAEHGIVGFCAVGPARDERRRHQGEVGALYCLDEYKGKGIGKTLFLTGLDHLRARGFASAYLWVLKDNPTIGFYERMGGVRVGGEKTIDLGAPLVEIAFEWRL